MLKNSCFNLIKWLTTRDKFAYCCCFDLSEKTGKSCLILLFAWQENQVCIEICSRHFLMFRLNLPIQFEINYFFCFEPYLLYIISNVYSKDIDMEFLVILDIGLFKRLTVLIFFFFLIL